MLTKNLIEPIPISPDVIEFVYDNIVGWHAHFYQVGNRSLRLLLERGSTTVPELCLAEQPVDHRRRASTALEGADAERHRLAVGKTQLRIVAGSAGDGIVSGKPGIEIEIGRASCRERV